MSEEMVVGGIYTLPFYENAILVYLGEVESSDGVDGWYFDLTTFDLTRDEMRPEYWKNRCVNDKAMDFIRSFLALRGYEFPAEV